MGLAQEAVDIHRCNQEVECRMDNTVQSTHSDVAVTLGNGNARAMQTRSEGDGLKDYPTALNHEKVKK